jgi:NTP pyrophosphatase (non-canonical NTP hydrolase)
MNVSTDVTILAEKAMRFNQGKPDWTQVDFKAMEPMIRVLEFGAKKYAKGNWRKGLSKESCLNSLQRHVGELIDAVNKGQEETDHESGLHLIGHIMCNCMFYSALHVMNEQNKTD